MKTTYEMLEETWELTAIRWGVEKEIWDADPYDKTIANHPVIKWWLKAGYMVMEEEAGFAKYKLTDDFGVPAVFATDLVDYELSMVDQQLAGQFETDPEKYEKLREALAQYSLINLPEFFKFMMMQVKHDQKEQDKHMDILDFGGGVGGYLSVILEAVPESSGILLDKAPAETLLREHITSGRAGIAKFDWFKDEDKRVSFMEVNPKFDVIILSEVLHVFSPEHAKILLKDLRSMLTPKGTLYIIEQNPSLRLDWRLHDMTNGGRCYPIGEVGSHLIDGIFKPQRAIMKRHHYLLECKHVETH